jgi:hypothetical protein
MQRRRTVPTVGERIRVTGAADTRIVALATTEAGLCVAFVGEGGATRWVAAAALVHFAVWGMWVGPTWDGAIWAQPHRRQQQQVG